MSASLQNGHALGFHRVLDNPKVLPQNALRLDPMSPICSNEILIDVEYLQIDAASFHQLRGEMISPEAIAKKVNEIVSERGKMQNPVTGSGGMLLGTVKFIGANYPRADVKVGDRIATLISLTATPLRIDEILNVDIERERIRVKGQAILFERSLFAPMPSHLSEGAALAVFDICGAAPLVHRHVKKGDQVFVMGLGKAGKCVVAYLRQHWGNDVSILGIDGSEESVRFCNKHYSANGRADFSVLNAQDAIHVMNWVEEMTDGKMASLSVNLVNVANTEMPTVLATCNRGRAIFFSMATDFKKAALGTEAVGLDIDLLMGAGYVERHAEEMMDLLKRDENLRNYFERHFGS